MNKFMAITAAVALGVSSAWAGCPKYQTVEVQVKELVPVKVTKMVEKEVQVKEYKQVEKQVQVTVYKTFWEDKTFEGKKQVQVDEEYTVNEIRTKMVDEQKTRKVCTMVPKMIEKEVTVCTYKEECDPCSGKTKKIPVTEVKKVQCQINEAVWKDEAYTEKKCVSETVPVKMTRKVCKWEPTTITMKVAACKPVQETRTVVVCEPIMVTKKVQEAVCETVMQEVVKCVKKKVPVCEPCDACAAK